MAAKKVVESKESVEGQLAFAAYPQVRPEEVCPYPKGAQKGSNSRTEWMVGFIEARTNARIGHILAKYPG